MQVFVKAAKGTLEHMFNNYRYCGSWCGSMKANQKGKLYIDPDGYLDKKKEDKIYAQLKTITENKVMFFPQAEHASV